MEEIICASDLCSACVPNQNKMLFVQLFICSMSSEENHSIYNLSMDCMVPGQFKKKISCQIVALFLCGINTVKIM